MKLPIIYQNNILQRRGFLTVEILLAFSLFILFTISTFTLSSSMMSLKIWSLEELERMKSLTQSFDDGIYDTKVAYGNDTEILSNNLFSITQSDYVGSVGRNSCDARLGFDEDKIGYFNNGIPIGSSNPSTDLEVRNGIVYVTTDSSSASLPDLYILNARNPSDVQTISSLNTGPGLSAVEVAGPYLFVAQASTVNQLQIIDIHNRSSPKLISQLKLNLPTPTTTSPFATSIFYSRGFIYLGTVKWTGSEFNIIDVSDPLHPIIAGSFETSTQINDIYVRSDVAYLASSDGKQLRVLNVSDKSNPVLVDSFSPNGWQTQEGKIFDYFEKGLSFGRTVGGFNVTTNHEIFTFASSSENLIQNFSKDITGGVYGILLRQNNIFLLTHSLNKEFQVFDRSLGTKIFDFSLGTSPVKMACDGSVFYFATGDSKGISILKLDE